MNIAVILDKDEKEGGAFQDALSKILLLAQHRSKKYNFIFFTTIRKNVTILKKYNIGSFYFKWSHADKFFAQVMRLQLVSNILRTLRILGKTKLDRLLKKHDADLVYFMFPSYLSLALTDVNFIFTVWDMCFLKCMEFPEVYANREFERRQELYGIALRKAIMIIADSDYTKRLIERQYDIDEQRVTYIPLLPSVSVSVIENQSQQNEVDIKKRYKIKGEYIFYPAQFWPHKNHVYILEALKILRDRYNIIVNVIFCGSDKGNLNFVLRKAKELGVGGQTFYIGFVESSEIPYLYRQAIALVMPTYFRPTNIPPLEAFKLGCPVLYSDLPDLRDQVKDAVLPLDLKNPESLCDGLLKVLEHPSEIDILINNGKKKIESLEKENYWPIFKAVFDDYNQKMKCWK